MTSERIVRIAEEIGLTRETMADPGVYATSLLVSLAAAFAASLLYRFFYERRGTGSQAHRSFPLLAISVTTLFIGVQISLPLSLGLLGALSIIRFRVPIKEPEEVGFIMLVIASSISAATGQYKFMVILLAFALVALLLARGAGMWKLLRRDGIIVLALRLPDGAPAPDLDATLAPFFRRLILESASKRDGTDTYQYVFSGLRTNISELQQRLAALLPLQSANIFLDRPGGIR